MSVCLNEQGGIVINSVLNTRTKIIQSFESIKRREQLHLVYGWFDVLTAEYCGILQGSTSVDSTLIALVFEENETRSSPLSAYDRAQMLAALECVDHVIICKESESDSVVSEFNPDSVIDIDSLQKRDVVRDVLKLQQSS